MLPINSFSIHDLVGFIVTVPLALIFYIIYWKFGRKLADLLFANWLACVSAYCLLAFLEDNLIREGQSSYGVPGAAETMLLLFRIVYVLGLFALTTELHFVLVYCRVNNFLRRNIRWVYVATFLLMPLVWTPWWLAIRHTPHGEVASWLVAVPWMPLAGPLQQIFTVLWMAIMVYSAVILYTHGETARRLGMFSQYRLVRLAVVFQAATASVDAVVGALHLATISFLPTSTMIVAILVATALVRERIHEGRLKEQMTREMDLAADLQKKLLPKNYPPVCGYELAGWSRAALHAGGDTYDFHCLPNGKWMITIADASGHGLPAALVVAETRAILRTMAQQKPDVGAILEGTQQHLLKDLTEGAFVTAFIGILDPLNGVLTYGSAGHGPVIFTKTQGEGLAWEGATAAPLALLDHTDFRSGIREHQFKPGAMLVLVSDGLYETLGHNSEQFGIRRLVEAVVRAQHEKPEVIISELLRDVDAFRSEPEQADDMTVVILRRRGLNQGAAGVRASQL